MRIRYYFRLLRDIIRIRFAKVKEYPADFLTLFITVPAYLLVTLFFWHTIFSHVRVIAGWTLADVVLLQAFMQLGFVFWNIMYVFPEELSDMIISGELNTVLSKPANPILYMMLLYFDVVNGLWNIPEAAVYFIAAFWLGAQVSLTGLLAGTFLMLLGVTITSVIVFLIESLSFWFGRTNLLDLFYRAYFTVVDYPLAVFPLSVKFLLVMFLPVAFFTTGPALVSLRDYPLTGVVGLFGLSLLVLGVWFLAAWIAWKAGLKRYEAYGS